MKYDVKKVDSNQLRFVFSFTAKDFEDAAREFAAEEKKQGHSKLPAAKELKKEILTAMAGKAYSKAAMEYPQEIYYSPALRLVEDSPGGGVVIQANVQIDPVFSLGSYETLSLSAEELAQVEEDAAGVPAEHRADTRRYLLQSALVKNLDALCEGEVPDTMASERAGKMMSAFEQQLESNGMKIEDYFKECNTSSEELFVFYMDEAKKQLHSRLALYELAKKEKLLASEEEYTAELERLSERSMLPLPRLREIFAKREEPKLRQDIAIAKAAEFLGQLADRLYPEQVQG